MSVVVKQETMVYALIFFILVGFVAMFIGSYATEALGVGGIVGSVVFLLIFFGLMTALGRQTLTWKNALWFIVFGLIAAVASGFLGTWVGVKDQLMLNMMFLVVFFAIFWYMGKRRLGLKR